MSAESLNKRRGRPNAFERAREQTLGFESGWWTSLSGANLSEISFSPAQFIQLGDDTVLGGLMLDRRIVTYRAGEHDEEHTEVITRPVMTRFSGLPIELLERIARDLLTESDDQWRRANLEHIVATAHSFGEAERFEIACDILGSEASKEELAHLAAQLKLPEALLAAGIPGTQY